MGRAEPQEPRPQAVSDRSTAYFDEVAEGYASWYERETPGGYALRTRRQRALELLEGPAGRVLDVGCGAGVFVNDLTRLGHEFWGVDASPRMVEQCLRHFAHLGTVRFAVGDATALAYPDEFFDTVICMGVIDRIRAYESAIREMVRVLRTGGILLVSFPNVLSPYAAWKTHAFYPLVAWFQQFRDAVWTNRHVPSLVCSFVKLYTPRTASTLVRSHGAEPVQVVYYYYNLFLSPLDELLPRLALRATERLERLRCGRLRWLGAGFILKARKRPPA